MQSLSPASISFYSENDVLRIPFPAILPLSSKHPLSQSIQQPLSTMQKVTLYFLERPDIKISIELYFNESGQLILNGYDIGKSVTNFWGDSDYEYTITIEPKEVEKLCEIFSLEPDNREALLEAIKDRFGVNEAYTLFEKFLKTHGIDYSGFTYN